MRKEREIREIVDQLQVIVDGLAEQLTNPTGEFDFMSLANRLNMDGCRLAALLWVLGEDTILFESDAERNAKDAAQAEAFKLREQAPKPQEVSDGFTGWLRGLRGNNYRRRGRVLRNVGSDAGEPWYIADDGTQWSAFDVVFHPDQEGE